MRPAHAACVGSQHGLHERREEINRETQELSLLQLKQELWSATERVQELPGGRSRTLWAPWLPF